MTGIYLFSNRTRTLKGTRTPHHNIPRYSSISVLGLIGVAAPLRSRYINSPATGINHRPLTPPPQISVLVSISVSVSAHCAAKRNSTSHLPMDTDTDTLRATSKINHHRHRRMHFIVRRLRFMKPNFSGWTPTCRMCLHIYFPST